MCFAWKKLAGKQELIRTFLQDKLPADFWNRMPLCVTSGNSKINAVDQLCKDFKVNHLCNCETQVDWQQVPKARWFHNSFGTGTETRSIVARNINEQMMCQNQFRGCAMMAMSTISSEVWNTGVDNTGVGRLCWMLLGSGAKKTRIVMAYQPSNSGWSARTMVKDQQSRYFWAQGNARFPRSIFFEHLVSHLVLWKQSGDDIIPLGNFYENVYSGRLARCLAMVSHNFVELCQKHTGKPIPPTHHSGSMPIDRIFTTSGIECVNAFLLPHYDGVGDHQCFIMDISSASMIGTSFPSIVRCAARKL